MEQMNVSDSKRRDADSDSNLMSQEKKRKVANGMKENLGTVKSNTDTIVDQTLAQGSDDSYRNEIDTKKGPGIEEFISDGQDAIRGMSASHYGDAETSYPSATEKNPDLRQAVDDAMLHMESPAAPEASVADARSRADQEPSATADSAQASAGLHNASQAPSDFNRGSSRQRYSSPADVFAQREKMPSWIKDQVRSRPYVVAAAAVGLGLYLLRRNR